MSVKISSAPRAAAQPLESPPAAKPSPAAEAAKPQSAASAVAAHYESIRKNVFQPPASSQSAHPLERLVAMKAAGDSARPGGVESFSSAKRTYATNDAAKAAFAQAAGKMLDVNHWKGLGPDLAPTEFKLYGADGQPRSGVPKQGDFLRINLPGPDGGPDWVRIETIRQSPSKLSIVVRPSHDPTEHPPRLDVTAHFFTHEATNTFTLERRGKSILASVHGLDEFANTSEAGGFLKSIRNTAVATGGWAGVQRQQWEAFTRSLVAG